MQIQRGVDGLWHHRSVSPTNECRVKLQGKTERIGSEDAATIPQPPRHELCPWCFPPQHQGVYLPPEMISDLIDLRFREHVLGGGAKVVWRHDNDGCMGKVEVLVFGPDFDPDEHPFTYDARKERWSLRLFFDWWSAATLAQGEKGVAPEEESD